MSSNTGLLVSVKDDYQHQHYTIGPSLFTVCANALYWRDVDCLTFRTSRRLDDGEILSAAVCGLEE